MFSNSLVLHPPLHSTQPAVLRRWFSLTCARETFPLCLVKKFKLTSNLELWSLYSYFFNCKMYQVQWKLHAPLTSTPFISPSTSTVPKHPFPRLRKKRTSIYGQESCSGTCGWNKELLFRVAYHDATAAWQRALVHSGTCWKVFNKQNHAGVFYVATVLVLCSRPLWVYCQFIFILLFLSRGPVQVHVIIGEDMTFLKRQADWENGKYDTRKKKRSRGQIKRRFAQGLHPAHTSTPSLHLQSLIQPPTLPFSVFLQLMKLLGETSFYFSSLLLPCLIFTILSICLSLKKVCKYMYVKVHPKLPPTPVILWIGRTAVSQARSSARGARWHIKKDENLHGLYCEALRKAKVLTPVSWKGMHAATPTYPPPPPKKKKTNEKEKTDERKRKLNLFLFTINSRKTRENHPQTNKRKNRQVHLLKHHRHQHTIHTQQKNHFKSRYTTSAWQCWKNMKHNQQYTTTHLWKNCAKPTEHQHSARHSWQC